MPAELITMEELQSAGDDFHAFTLPALPAPEMKRALRRAAGVPIKQLARVLGVTYDAVAKHERGVFVGWRSVQQERRVRRVYAARHQSLLTTDPAALREAVALGPAPRRGPRTAAA